MSLHSGLSTNLSHPIRLVLYSQEGRIWPTRVPDDKLRARSVATPTEQAAGDDPPFLIDYWGLNLRRERPGQGH
jgi:hypothetical protein